MYDFTHYIYCFIVIMNHIILEYYDKIIFIYYAKNV